MQGWPRECGCRVKRPECTAASNPPVLEYQHQTCPKGKSNSGRDEGTEKLSIDQTAPSRFEGSPAPERHYYIGRKPRTSLPGVAKADYNFQKRILKDNPTYFVASKTKLVKSFLTKAEINVIAKYFNYIQIATAILLDAPVLGKTVGYK